MVAVVSEKGGARVGKLNATWPFATLSADPFTLKLSCLGKDYVFEKSRIKRLSKHSGLLSSGLRIEHDLSYPSDIVFWTLNFNDVRSRLGSLGYEFQD